jgi:hypothetical protein
MLGEFVDTKDEWRLLPEVRTLILERLARSDGTYRHRLFGAYLRTANP